MKKEKRDLYVFGYGLAIIILIFVVRHGMKHGMGVFSWIFCGIAAVLTIMTAINVESIKPFYRRWMKVAHFIGTTITATILAVLFYGVFSPVGLVLRLINKDLLDQKIDHKKESYWSKHTQEKFDQERAKQQF